VVNLKLKALRSSSVHQTPVYFFHVLCPVEAANEDPREMTAGKLGERGERKIPPSPLCKGGEDFSFPLLAKEGDFPFPPFAKGGRGDLPKGNPRLRGARL